MVCGDSYAAALKPSSVTEQLIIIICLTWCDLSLQGNRCQGSIIHKNPTAYRKLVINMDKMKTSGYVLLGQQPIAVCRYFHIFTQSWLEFSLSD